MGRLHRRKGTAVEAEEDTWTALHNSDLLRNEMGQLVSSILRYMFEDVIAPAWLRFTKVRNELLFIIIDYYYWFSHHI